MSLYTTLRRIRKYQPCAERYRKLRRALGKGWGADRKIPLMRILDINGLADALWALRAVPDSQKEERDRVSCLFALNCAEHVLPLFEKAFPADDRPRKAIQAARDFANGKIPLRDLAEATRAAFDASCVAYAAAPEDDEDKFTLAERAASCAAKAAGFGEIGPSYDYVSVLDVVSNTAKEAVDCAACSSAVAARIAANNAGDSWNAAWSVGWNAGYTAESAWQEGVFLRYIGDGENIGDGKK